MSEEKGDKTEVNTRGWIRYAAAFLAGAVVGALVVYFLQGYRHETGRFATNKERDADASSAAHRAWAQRLALPGVENLHKVSDVLYRGAQPEDEAFAELKRMGITTVVNLRLVHSDRHEAEEAGLGYEHIDMEAWRAEDDEIVRFLRVVTDPERTPVFVHCKFGADRTGTMCAIYRIAVEGWTRQEAIDEMTRGGFGFHEKWDNLVEYLREVDIDELKRRAAERDAHAAGT